MPASGPHYLLFAEAVSSDVEGPGWRFALQPVGEGEPMAAEDVESDADRNRLALLALVRGLEALDAPSRVTLLSGSRYVRRGIRSDLAAWREQNWHWERFDQLVPIRDLDLWQRVDRALAIHQVECCWGLWTADCVHTDKRAPGAPGSSTPITGAGDRPARYEAWSEPALSRTA